MYGLWFRHCALEQTRSVSIKSDLASAYNFEKLTLFSIMGSERTKKYLLYLIIFNGVVFHTTMTVLCNPRILFYYANID